VEKIANLAGFLDQFAVMVTSITPKLRQQGAYTPTSLTIWRLFEGAGPAFADRQRALDVR
jgi:hypothetical protein